MYPPRKYIEREADRSKQHEGNVQADVWNGLADPFNLVQSDDCENSLIPKRRSCRQQGVCQDDNLIRLDSNIHNRTMEPSDDEDGHDHQNPFYWSREHAQVEFSCKEGYRSLGHRGKISDNAPQIKCAKVPGRKDAGR